MQVGYSINSKNDETKVYTCRLFILFHSRDYTEFRDTAETSFQDMDVKLVCETRNHNILTISGFSTEDQAIRYLNKLRIAFHWLMLDQGIVVEAALEPEEIQRHCNVRNGCTFKSADGLPSTHILEIPYGFIHTTYEGGGSIAGASIALNGLRAGLDIATRIIPEIDQSLNLSLDLYRSSFLQENLRARFTMLISSLECLTSKDTRDAWQIGLIDKFIAEVADHDLSTEEASTNDVLKSKKESLIAGLRGLKSKPKKQLVMQEIKQLYGDSEDYRRVNDIIKASFGKRNDVLHEGKDVTREEVERLDTVVSDLLRHRIRSLPKRQLLDDLF
jgi:hypothetical protein